jgi:hypothetical protein
MYLLHNLIFFFIFTENLELPQIFQGVAHPEVGKYFHEFAGNHYITNNEKLQEYPGDMEVVEKLLLQHQQESMNVDSMPS